MKIIISGMERQDLLFFPPILPGPDIIICVQNAIYTIFLPIPANKNKDTEVDEEEK